jgi:hypothetical protein
MLAVAGLSLEVGQRPDVEEDVVLDSLVIPCGNNVATCNSVIKISEKFKKFYKYRINDAITIIRLTIYNFSMV